MSERLEGPGDVAAGQERLLPASLRSGLLSMRIVLDAPVESAWEWLTRPDRLVQWSPVVPDRVLAGD